VLDQLIVIDESLNINVNCNCCSECMFVSWSLTLSILRVLQRWWLCQLAHTALCL